MKRYFLIALALCLVLGGCGRASVPEPTTEPPATTEPATQAPTQLPTEPATEPPYEPPISTQPPEIWETISPDETETPAEPLIDPEQAVEDILAKYGCTGSLGAVTLLAVAAAAVALTKKKE